MWGSRARRCGGPGAARDEPGAAAGQGVIGAGSGGEWNGDFGKSAFIQKISKGVYYREQGHEVVAVRGSGVKRRICVFKKLFFANPGENGAGEREGGAGRVSGLGTCRVPAGRRRGPLAGRRGRARGRV